MIRKNKHLLQTMIDHGFSSVKIGKIIGCSGELACYYLRKVGIHLGPSHFPSHEDRFLNYMSIGNPNECWEWKGPKSKDGYGIMIRGADAHRFSYEYFRGPILKGLCVCHHCDNPSCVNPNHLFVGTSSDNRRDYLIKQRMAVSIPLF